VADSLSLFSKSIRERLLMPGDFFTAELKHMTGDRSFVFEADAYHPASACASHCRQAPKLNASKIP
jgi:hypothetical protein